MHHPKADVVEASRERDYVGRRAALVLLGPAATLKLLRLDDAEDLKVEEGDLSGQLGG